jgi:hypothetical protein
MAKLSASKALENYKLKQISNLASALQDSTKASMARRNAISFEEDDEDKPPKPSEILKEYQSRIEIEEIQEQEREREETGMSRGEFKDYEDTVETQKALAKTLASEKRTVSRTIASEGRAAEKVEATAIADKVDAAKVTEETETAIQDRITKGSGFLPSIIRGQFPQTDTTFGKPSDIIIITDSLDAPDRTKTKAYFTLEDIDYMIKNNEFENAGISRGDVVNALNVDSSTGKAGFSIGDVQKLMFKFLETPYGKGMATAQKMKFQDPNTIKVVSTVRLGDPEE